MYKSLIAALAIAAALFGATMTGAQANSSVSIHIGVGGYHAPHYRPHYRPYHAHRPYYAPRRHILPRRAVHRSLRHRGYHHCRNMRLRHHAYRVTCAKRGKLFRLRVNARNARIINRHRIRFVFKRSGNPLLILRLGELPVLPQHYWKNRDFKATTFEPPMGSGPYRITQVRPGRSLVFERVKDYWGKDLPVNRGKYNFNRVEVEFYRDADVAFEAFKAGEFDIYIEHQAKNWFTGYDFPAVISGSVIKAQIAHQIPTQTQGLFMNTRRGNFADIRVREALGLMFNFEWTNRTLFNNAYQRSVSYYPNSEFTASDVPAGREFLILSPYRAQLPPKLFTQPFAASKTDGGGVPRDTIRRALNLLAEAGWKFTDRGLANSAGQPLRFEILLVNPNLERILQPYIEDLTRIGVDAHLRTVDRAQYKQRLDQFDFDMILMTLNQTLSPGLEQWQYFHSSQANVKGSKNYAGVANPVVDNLLNRLLAAKPAMTRWRRPKPWTGCCSGSIT